MLPTLACLQIPTFHAKPLQPECDVWCDFPVSDRPNAVAQWISHVGANPSELKGAWVAMLECDYVWMRPLPVPGDARDSSALGYQFKFDYIMPTHPGVERTGQRMDGCEHTFPVQTLSSQDAETLFPAKMLSIQNAFPTLRQAFLPRSAGGVPAAATGLKCRCRPHRPQLHPSPSHPH
eukprot:354828-Chlamydomonas_euryale.AAC.2